MNFNKALKLGIALMLFACLLNMTYGYFQFVRFLSCIGFGYLAYKANSEQRKIETIIYGVLGLLFQPFLKVSLGRELWNIVDVGVAIYLIVNTIKVNKIK